jgi:hypothetical protein
MARIVELAKQGDLTDRLIYEAHQKLTLYETRFQVRPETIQTLVDLATLLIRHPHADVFANEQRISLYPVTEVLTCFEQSCGISDARAHCWVSLPRLCEDSLRPLSYPLHIHIQSPNPGCCGLDADQDPQVETEQGTPDTAPIQEPVIWFVPCRLIQHRTQRVSLQHPSTLRAQMDALLRQAHCEWCPRLQHLDLWEVSLPATTPE